MTKASHRRPPCPRRWRRHAAAAEEQLCEQEALAQGKHDAAAAAVAEAAAQAGRAEERDAAATALSGAIDYAEDAALWASRGDAAALEVLDMGAQVQELERAHTALLSVRLELLVFALCREANEGRQERRNAVSPKHR